MLKNIRMIIQSKTAQGKIKEFLAREKEWQSGGY